MEPMGGFLEYGIAALMGAGAMVVLGVLALILDEGTQGGIQTGTPYS